MYDPSSPNPSPEGSITDGITGPQGLAVDSKGALYVSNVAPTKGTITVYSPGDSKPRLTIPGPGFYGLAVDSKGDIFGSYTAGLVYVYKPGTKKPYKKIGISSNPTGIAVDSKDDVWVADVTGSRVWIIDHGTYQVTESTLKGLNGPIGLAFGAHDSLYVANSGSNNVTVYKAGSNSPASTIANGIASPTLNGITATGTFFQSNQQHNVVGYKQGRRAPFSTIVGNTDPLGIASFPLVKK